MSCRERHCAYTLRLAARAGAITIETATGIQDCSKLVPPGRNCQAGRLKGLKWLDTLKCFKYSLLMEQQDPYRNIARFFPAFDRFLDLFMPRIRADLVAFLRGKNLSRVIDLGCGAGGLSRSLADRGFSPVCVDVSEAMLKEAGKSAGREPVFPVVHSDGEVLPFSREFDASVMRFVLHEMDPPVRDSVLAELLRVIHPGGYLIFIDFIRPANTGGEPGLKGRIGASLIRLIESQMLRIHTPHYENFLGFMREGGTLGFLEKRGEVRLEHSYFWGNIGLVTLQRPEV